MPFLLLWVTGNSVMIWFESGILKNSMQGYSKVHYFVKLQRGNNDMGLLTLGQKMLLLNILFAIDFI